MQDFQDILRTAMSSHGITMGDMADKIGVSRQQLYRYLRGEQVPTLGKADEILRKLGFELRLQPK